jgi:hypothetical protein
MFRGTHMFANLLHLISGRPASPEVARQPFIRAVHIRPREPRSARLERLIFGCWILIALKHVFVIWACRHYPVPFHQLWINFPTWLLAALATAIYYVRVTRH